MSLFLPKIYQKSIFDINYEKLRKIGIRFLIFDLDNTIALIEEKEASNEVISLLNALSKDFQILIASNNNKKRVNLFSQKINCDTYWTALKPLKRITRYIKKKYRIDMSKVAFIGDQIVTDILIGNRSGMLTILVDPLGNKDLKITSFNRFLERIVIKKLDFKKGVYYEKE